MHINRSVYFFVVLVMFLGVGGSPTTKADAISQSAFDPNESIALVPQSITYLVYGGAVEPFQILDESGAGGRSRGYVSDIVARIFEGSPIKIDEVIKPIKRAKREMESGTASRWIAYGLRSWNDPGLHKWSTFTNVCLLPYQLSLLFKKGTPPPDKETMKQYGVAWIQGYKYPGAQAFAESVGFEFFRVKDHRSAVKMVLSERVGYFMEEASRTQYALFDLGLEVSDFQYYPLTSEVPATEILLMMSNDLGQEVHDFINRRLLELQQSGELSQIASQYHLNVP